MSGRTRSESELEAPSSVTAARDSAAGDAGGPADELGSVRLDPGVLQELPRPRIERVRGAIAILGAIAVHAGVIIATSETLATVELGAGGDVNTISVEIVAASDLSTARTSASDAVADRSRSGATAREIGQDVESEAQRAQAESRRETTPEPQSATAAAASTRADTTAPEDVSDPDAPTLRRADRLKPKPETESVASVPDAIADRPAGEIPSQTPIATDADPAEHANDTDSGRRSTMDSAAVDAAVASRRGGGQSAPEPELDPAQAVPAARSRGVPARAYSAKVVEALAELEAYLNTANRTRGATVKGRVVLLITIGLDGRAERVLVATSSGTARLDALAKEDIAGFSFPPAPLGLTLAQRTYSLPITYR